MIDNLKVVKLYNNNKNGAYELEDILNSMKNEFGTIEIDVCIFYEGICKTIGVVRADSVKVYVSSPSGVYFYKKNDLVFTCSLSSIKALVNADIDRRSYDLYDLDDENECEKICICKSLTVDFE